MLFNYSIAKSKLLIFSSKVPGNMISKTYTTINSTKCLKLLPYEFIDFLANSPIR